MGNGQDMFLCICMYLPDKIHWIIPNLEYSRGIQSFLHECECDKAYIDCMQENSGKTWLPLFWASYSCEMDISYICVNSSHCRNLKRASPQMLLSMLRTITKVHKDQVRELLYHLYPSIVILIYNIYIYYKYT